MIHLATHLDRNGRYYHLERRWTPTGRFTTKDFRRYELVRVYDSGPHADHAFSSTTTR